MAAELGVCPAATASEADGLNGGEMAGRICWAVSGNFSDDGEVRCASAGELVTCMACEFFKDVLMEEGIYEINFLKPCPERKRLDLGQPVGVTEPNTRRG
jgi:hypothetical protein